MATNSEIWTPTKTRKKTRGVRNDDLMGGEDDNGGGGGPPLAPQSRRQQRKADNDAVKEKKAKAKKDRKGADAPRDQKPDDKN